MKRIYLDNNASTFLDPEVFQVLAHELEFSQGNPSSTHFFGQELKKKLINARHDIASFFKVRPTEIYFTSGATESANFIIQSFLDNNPKAHVLTTSIEHDAVYKTFKRLEKKGFDITFLKPDSTGRVGVDAVRSALKSNTALISVMAANNETGVINPILEIAEFAKSQEIPFFVDATQIIGKGPFEMHEGITAFCMSAHKIHGPKGIGLAYIKRKTEISPLIVGGEQEFGKRGGTENTPAILAFAKAILLLQPESIQKMQALKNRFESEICKRLEDVSINGSDPRLCNTSNLAFKNVDGEALLTGLDMQGIAASHGSACSSGALKPSRVLLEMGLEEALARASIRFSLSRFTTDDEMNRAIEIVSALVSSLRNFGKNK